MSKMPSSRSCPAFRAIVLRARVRGVDRPVKGREEDDAESIARFHDRRTPSIYACSSPGLILAMDPQGPCRFAMAS